jgi:Spy/CpxP family protein refolding chaperone
MHGDPGFGGAPRKFGPGGGMHPLLPPGRWWKNADIATTIGLNDGQIQKIEQIFQDSRMKLVDIHAGLEKEEIKLEPLLEADNPDENAVLGAIDRIAAARAALEKANAQMAFSIRRVLTPDQWKKLRALRSHRGHFPPPMGGPRDGGGHQDWRRRPNAGPDAPTAPPAPENNPAPGDGK